MPSHINAGWKDIQEAPTEPVVGCRSEIILGIDKHGDVHKTFYVGSETNGGPAWVITGSFGVQTCRKFR